MIFNNFELLLDGKKKNLSQQLGSPLNSKKYLLSLMCPKKSKIVRPKMIKIKCTIGL